MATIVTKEQRQFKVVGTTPIRPDGADKVTGRAQFGEDVHIPGMLYAKVLRSPHAHARIKSIDVSKALALPGVRAVMTGADIPDIPETLTASGEAGLANLQDISDNVMAKKKVLFHGHTVGAVAADSPHIANEALSLIAVEYEILTPVLTAPEAMKEGAPVLHENLIPSTFMIPIRQAGPNSSHLQLKTGDLEQGFKEANVIVEREFVTQTVHQGYIETHACTAYWDPTDHLTIWTTTQGAFAIRDETAGILQLPLSSVKVIPTEIGGGFGGKDMAFIEPIAAVLSRKAGRPVQLVMDRSEVLKATGPSCGSYMRVKMGATKDGRLTAAEVYLAFEGGAYPGWTVAPAAMTSIVRYNIPHAQVDGYDVVVNKPKTRPYRAPGSTQAQFGVETVVDEMAEKVGMDPIDFRLKNAIRTGERNLMGVPMASIGGVEVLETVKNHPHYTAPLEGPNRGRGVAFASWFGAGITSSAHLAVNSDGTVNLSTGSCDLSGTRMTLAMQAAEALGIPLEDVKPSVADTDSIGYTFQSVGSRTTFATGWAAYEAAQKVNKRMAERAALIWGTTPEMVEMASGVFRDKGDASRQFSFKELAHRLEHTGGPIAESTTVTPTSVGPQTAAIIIDVEVDPETGKVDILRCTTVQDAGKAVHPDYVEGQMQGGCVQGIGWALNEEYFYDADGHLLNSTFLDYRQPTSLDVPMIDTVIVEVPNPGHPYGVRGVGEISIVTPPAAIANAIYRAIGVRMNSLPMKPGKILEAIWDKERPAGST
jgi:CO/xanthine dehydrogenase Mo-binding subunit